MWDLYKKIYSAKKPSECPEPPLRPSPVIVAPPPAPASVVVEDSDWSLWADSVAFQESQFPTDTLPTPLEERQINPDNVVSEHEDPFSSVTKKSA